MALDYDDIVTIALGLPEVEERLIFRQPAVKRAGRYMFSPGHEPGCIAVKVGWDMRDRLLEQRPDLYFVTPHYEGWPGLLVRLDKLDEASARKLITASWEDAPKKATKLRNRV